MQVAAPGTQGKAAADEGICFPITGSGAWQGAGGRADTGTGLHCQRPAHQHKDTAGSHRPVTHPQKQAGGGPLDGCLRTFPLWPGKGQVPGTSRAGELELAPPA